MSEYNWRTIENCQNTIDKEKKLLGFYSQFKPYDYVLKVNTYAHRTRHDVTEVISNGDNSFNWNKHHPVYLYIDECESVIKNCEATFEAIKIEATPEYKKGKRKDRFFQLIAKTIMFFLIILFLYLLSFFVGDGGGDCTFFGIHAGCQ